MTKETIINTVFRALSSGTLSIDDVLVGINRFLIEEIKNVTIASGGKILFTQNPPRLISCCFSQVLELDVKEVWLENNNLLFCCKDPETSETYQLGVEDFVLGELRYIVDIIKK